MVRRGAEFGDARASIARSERRTQELEALWRAEDVLHRSLQRDDVLRGLVAIAADILHADKTSVLVWDERRERLVVGAALGFSAESLAGMSHGPGDGVTYLVATSGNSIAVEDASADPRVSHRITGPEGIRSLLHVPIRTDGEVFGVFGINYCQPHVFSGHEERILHALAQRAALALENARLFEAERLSRERLEVALDAGRMGTWEWDARTNRVTWSPLLEAIHGLAPGTFAGTFDAYFADVHPEDRERVAETIGASLSGGDHHLEYRIVWPDGSTHWVEARGRAIRDSAQETIGLRGVCMDVTGRKLAEAERDRLLNSEQAARENAEAAAGRITSLQYVTAALSRAASPADVVQVVLTEGIATIGASSGAVMQVSADGSQLEVLGGVGAMPGESERQALLADPQRSSPGGSARATLPMRLDGRLLGVMTLGFGDQRVFSAEERAFLDALAQQCAQALERARLYEQARTLAALEERQKLARELHDSVSQALYGIALGAQTAQGALVSGEVNEVAAPLRYVLELAEAGMAEMRALIFELRPESLERDGLAVALEKYVAAVRARHRLQVTANIDQEPPVPFPTKEALYRIAQEALHNIVKHAHASSVDLSLTSDADIVTLEIADDGVGFDVSGAFPGHLGLHSMRERAEQAGGTLEVTSAPGHGTRVKVAISAREGQPEKPGPY